MMAPRDAYPLQFGTSEINQFGSKFDGAASIVQAFPIV